MTKVTFFGGLTVLMLCALSACSEVDNCKRGAPGCVDGPPVDGKCKFGLERHGDECREPGGDDDDGSGDGDGDGRDGSGDGSDGDSGTPVSCECPAEELCAADGESCVYFCETPERLPGSEAATKPEPVACKKAEGEPDLTFNDVCLRRCKNTAQRQSWFCESEPVVCAEGDAAMLLACNTDCPGNDIACLQESCDAVRSSGCTDTVCTSGTPSCAGVRCNNDCGGGLNYDGWCDDGDTFSTSDAEGSQDSALCSWGTDCADCGPRRGDDVPENIPIGGQCHFNSRCEGHKQVAMGGMNVPDLETNRAWCAKLNQPVVGNFRCVLDASGPGETCPTGYDTVDLGITVGALRAKACVPPANFCE